MGIGAQENLEASLLKPGMASGGGTSIQSTWPVRSAASRVVASGMGKKLTLSTLGTRSGPSSRGRFQLGALAGHQAGELEGASAGRVHRHLAPIPPDLLPLGRAAEQDIAHLEGDEAGGTDRGELDRVVVELAPALQQGDTKVDKGACLESYCGASLLWIFPYSRRRHRH